ncbi:AraC family transcriptional regulator [Rhodococcoides trifolii]|uniref:AraC family transcriptional regulator n=1 Tax=Rhodococcoides trifolii TaxID=908250 RepID=A0A917FYN2_9NOCA|nr:helix-turn-helix domain-containing protein [Rhodococcus trifolii]GGG14371.1 AraC family transcriptional regulator [Rhodococcus trifolii]
MAGVSSGATARPCPALRPFVKSYDGYRMSGFDAGTHVGMPSPDITVVIPLDDPLELAWPGETSSRFGSLASGLGTTPITIFHTGAQHGIQLALTPLGARTLLGVPASEISDVVVSLDDLLGGVVTEIDHRIASVSSWRERFDVLDEVLIRRLDADTPRPDDRVAGAWHLLVGGSDARVQSVADAVGWSRRHLNTKFLSEYGVTPKDAARVARFDRSHQLLKREHPLSLATIAAQCGYYDQAHMAREWRELAGSAPSVWRANEQFAFVQDSADLATEYWSA